MGKRQVLFVVTAVTVLATISMGAAALFYRPPALQNIAKNGSLLAKSPIAQTQTQMTDTTAADGKLDSSTGTNNESAKAAPPPAAEVSPANSCKSVEAKQQEAYNQELKKQKITLDNALIFQMGLSNSGRLVEDYNKTATDLFNKYTAQAQAANCQFFLQQPALLPLTYQP